MLRQGIRLRKEYLVKRAYEAESNEIRRRKIRVKTAVEEGKPLAPEDRDLELSLRGKLDLQDINALSAIDMDDEYAFAGVRDPRVLLTTSRDPSSRLLEFVKELKLMIPGADRLNRGKAVLKDLVDLAKANDVTDIVIVHEHRGVPDGMVVSHMPLGPTAYFTLEDAKLRHDLPDKPKGMPTAPPHLVFENLGSKLGHRITSILKFLFPPPSVKSKRLIAFVNKADRILVRHYTWSDERLNLTNDGSVDSTVVDRTDSTLVDRTDPQRLLGTEYKKKKEEAKSLYKINIEEVGPRFVLKPYKIELGTVDMKNVEVEWALRSFVNKPKPQLG